MTFGAGLKIANVHGKVRARDGIRFMRVASVATIRAVIDRMAHLARRGLAAVIEWKRVSNQARRSPARRGVARGARVAKLSAMNRRVSVALHTLTRRAAKTIREVTLGTCNGRVFAVEREHLVVIETAQTIRAIVTRKALFAHRRAMFRDKSRVRACVATDTRGAEDARFRIARGRESVARATGERRVIVIAFVARE